MRTQRNSNMEIPEQEINQLNHDRADLRRPEWV